LEGLTRLKSDFGASIVLLICTNKPEQLAQKLVKHSVLNGFFDPVNKFVTGAVLGQPQKPDRLHVIRAINNASNITSAPADNVIIVGDGRNDILVAHTLKCRSIGVTYGFSERAQLEALRPTVVVDNFYQVTEVVTKWIRT
jgi:phosphoglycolate phosphatase